MRNNIETPRRTGMRAAVALSVAAIVGSGVAAAESNKAEAITPPILPPPTEVLFPECNPFYFMDQLLQTNPIDPEDFVKDFGNIHSGTLILDEETGEFRPYTYKDLPYGAYRYVTERPEDASKRFGFSQEVLDKLPTVAEQLTEQLGDEYCPAPEIEIFSSETDQVATSQEDIK